jgi:hypothetical protein
MKSLRGKNHHVFFDNLYTNVPSALYLLKHGIYTCGTVCQNCKFLPTLIKNPEAMPCGNSRAYQDDNSKFLTAVIWADTKVVRFLSTLNQPDVVTQTHRRVGGQHTQV